MVPKPSYMSLKSAHSPKSAPVILWETVGTLQPIEITPGMVSKVTSRWWAPKCSPHSFSCEKIIKKLKIPRMGSDQMAPTDHQKWEHTFSDFSVPLLMIRRRHLVGPHLRDVQFLMIFSQENEWGEHFGAHQREITLETIPGVISIGCNVPTVSQTITGADFWL